MLLLFNLSPTEVVIILVVAVLVFGRRLPEVAGQAAGMVQRMRRSIADLRRETGIDRELEEARRKLDEARREVEDVRRGVQRSVPRGIEIPDVQRQIERAVRESEPAPERPAPGASEAARHPDRLEPPAD